MPNTTYAIKAIDDNRFGGYTAVWGDKNNLDLQGDYFTRDTDFALEAYAYRPLIHHHGQTEQLGSVIIGTIDSWHKDDIGLWCEGKFKGLEDDIDLFDKDEREMRELYIEKIKEKIAAGELNFSSGALGHLVKRDDDGWLKQWWWGESSTTGAPAEPRRTEIELMKSIKGMDESFYKAEGEQPSQSDTPSNHDKQDVAPIAPPPEAIGDAESTNESPQPNHDEGANEMTFEELVGMIGEGEFTPEQLAELVAQLNTMLDERSEETAADNPEDEEPEDDEEEKTVEEKLALAVADPKFLAKAVKLVEKAATKKTALQDQINTMKATPAGSGGKPAPAGKVKSNPRISTRSRYEEMNWEPEDYAFMITAKRALNKYYQPPTGFVREATAKLIKDGERLGLSAKSMDQLYGLESAAKANELEHSTQVGYGDEWVQDGWATTIIQKARNENRILSLFNSVPMPTDPYTMPIEGSDPVVMAGAETTAASQLVHNNSNVTPLSKIGTSNITMSSGMLRARVGISEVELEDAHVPVLPQKRKQLQRTLQDAMDAVLLSADTRTTGNINYNGGTIDSTDVTDVNGKFLYGGGAGLAYVPLVTDPTNLLRNMGGAPTLSALWDLQALLKEAYMEDQSNLAYIVDTRTWLQLRKIEELLTVNNYGSDATVLKGEVAKIGMIPVIVSSKLKLAADDGLVSSTAASNTKGRAILIYRPTNYIGYRRNPNVWAVQDQDFGATVLGVSVRMATTRFDDEGIAMLRNITV